jgi:hypothetical protein
LIIIFVGRKRRKTKRRKRSETAGRKLKRSETVAMVKMWNVMYTSCNSGITGRDFLKHHFGKVLIKDEDGR